MGKNAKGGKLPDGTKMDNSDRIEELAISLHLLIQKFNPLQGNIILC